MITIGGQYYLYRHIRLDTNEVFYVGISKAAIGSRYDPYKRMNTSRQRCKEWHEIVSSTEYLAEVVLESDSDEFIRKKEKEFVALYGRINMKTGTLVNRSEGGEMTFKTKNDIKKQLDTAKKNGSYEKTIDRIKKYSAKKGQIGSQVSIPVYMYDTTGAFVGRFDSREDCARAISTHGPEITKCINNRRSHKGYLFSSDFTGESILVESFRIRKSSSREVGLYNDDGIELSRYASVAAAAKELGLDRTKIYSYIRNKNKYNGVYWVYLK